MSRLHPPKRRPRKLLNPRPLPDHNVLVEYTKADGSTYKRFMTGEDYRNRMRASKAGRTAQANGTSHKWNSETARKAANKLWRTRWRKVNGIRIGQPSKRRPAVDHQSLRNRYAEANSAIWWSPEPSPLGTWFENLTSTVSGTTSTLAAGGKKRISERTALRKLGHLPSPIPRLPSRVLTRIKLMDGKLLAIQEPRRDRE